MAKHRLVVLGDSLSQGFMSAAVFSTELSYPAIIANELGLASTQFRYPSFSAFGGLPSNMEFYLRRLEERYGKDFAGLELFGAGFRLRGWMDEAEDYWERGAGTNPVFPDGTYHNLASWGMTVDDALFLDAGYCNAKVQEPTQDNLFQQVPENAFYRTALAVLNPSQAQSEMDRTAVGCAADLAADGGIENIIVALGANNALGTITSLKIAETEDNFLDHPHQTREQCNLWKPAHFKQVFEKLAARVESLQGERVFCSTVPHVVICPLARGVGTTLSDRMSADKRYFKNYVHFWITDDVFDPARHQHLTGEEAKHIDNYIDEYNEIIKAVVQQRRDRGLSWHVVDLGAALERVAFRRYTEIGEIPPGGPYVFPAGWAEALATAGLEKLTTEYIATAAGKIQRGGLFSLDGVHPTTMGYGLIAHEFISVMRQAGVMFRTPLGALRPEPVEVNFSRLIQRDTLVRIPPGLLDDAIGIMNWLDGWIGISGILRSIHGRSADILSDQ
jgi:hypothetical protein